MLYAFTSKMKKMKQKKFQNFPKIQRRRRRVSASMFTKTRTFWDVLSYDDYSVNCMIFVGCLQCFWEVQCLWDVSIDTVAAILIDCCDTVARAE